MIAAYTQAMTKAPEPKEPTDEEVRAAAAILSRRDARAGGLKSGLARAKRLSAERRKAIARKAAQARWAREKATTLSDRGLGDVSRVSHRAVLISSDDGRTV